MDDSVLDFGDEDSDVTAEEAFGLLANEIRLAILRELYETDDPLTFSELRRRVEVPDSGMFNYHLEKLQGHFVRQTDEQVGDARANGGYELRYAGEQVLRAVLSGVIGTDPVLEPIEVEEPCPFCGSPTEMSYRDEQLTVRCTACPGVVDREYPSGTVMSYGFPPAGFRGRSPEEILDAAHVLYDAKITPMMNGVCPECAGGVETSLKICPDHDADDNGEGSGESGLCETCETRFETWTRYACPNCQYARTAMVWFELLLYPAVVAFYHEHLGLEKPVPFDKLTHENARFFRAIDEEVIAREPPRVRVTVDGGDAVLQVTVNERLEVINMKTISGE